MIIVHIPIDPADYNHFCFKPQSFNIVIRVSFHCFLLAIQLYYQVVVTVVTIMVLVHLVALLTLTDPSFLYHLQVIVVVLLKGRMFLLVYNFVSFGCCNWDENYRSQKHCHALMAKMFFSVVESLWMEPDGITNIYFVYQELANEIMGAGPARSIKRQFGSSLLTKIWKLYTLV